jgi:2-polyprenyl-6-methoxyphenol hydroxylase-like FAD-dependent oxidoreductase
MANLRTDVLVIGGGLAGAATAYFLAREGVEVTLGSVSISIHRPRAATLGVCIFRFPSRNS